MLKGIGASNGYGIGKAVIIEDANLDYSSVRYAGAEAEKSRLQNAVDTFIKETTEMIEALKSSAGEKEAEILEGHLTMLNDPFMLSGINEQIDAGLVAEAAADAVFKMFYELDSILYREGELIDEWSGNKAEDLF